MLRFALIAFTVWCVVPQPIRNGPRKSTCAWDSTKNWKLYHLPNTNREIRMPTDSLRYLDNLPLNEDSIHSILCLAKKRDHKGPIFFQGVYLVSYEAGGGETVKVLVSSSGGFFYLPQDDAYFELPEDSQTRQDWLAFFLSTYMKMEK